MISILEAMRALAADRPIFHSEADFQHSLAWKIREMSPNTSVRLELPVVIDQQIQVDIWLRNQELQVAIELKYKTKHFRHAIGDEQYMIANHAAQNHSRYDFCADIERIEKLVSLGKASKGYAVILSNDVGYWNNPGNQTRDAAFRIHEGRRISGLLEWGEGSYGATVEKKGRPIHIIGTHEIHWADYSAISVGSGGRLRFAVVEVSPTA